MITVFQIRLNFSSRSPNRRIIAGLLRSAFLNCYHGIKRQVYDVAHHGLNCLRGLPTPSRIHQDKSREYSLAITSAKSRVTRLATITSAWALNTAMSLTARER